MINYKRPGGPLAGKPVQDYNGIWRNQFGEKIQFNPTDVEYSERFWSRNQPKGMKEIMEEIIASSAKNGFLGIFVSEEGLTERDKEKASAYRVLARQMGFEIGKYTHNENSYNIVAPIKRVSS